MDQVFQQVHNPLFSISSRMVGVSSSVSHLNVSSKPPSEGSSGTLTCPTTANSLNPVNDQQYVFTIPISSNNRPLWSSTLRITGFCCDVAGAALAAGDLISCFVPWNLAFACIKSFSIKLNGTGNEINSISDNATELLSLNWLISHSLESAESDPAICAPIWLPNDIYSSMRAGAADAASGQNPVGVNMSLRTRTERLLGIGKANSNLKPIILEIPLAYFVGADFPDMVLQNVSFIEFRIGVRSAADILESSFGTVAECTASRFNIARLEIMLNSPIVSASQAISNIVTKTSGEDQLVSSFPRERRAVNFAASSNLQLSSVKHMQRFFAYQPARGVTNTAVANSIYTSWGQFLPFIGNGLAALQRADLLAANMINAVQLFVGNDLSYPQQSILTSNSGRYNTDDLHKHFLLATNQVICKNYSPAVTRDMMRTTFGGLVVLSPYLLNEALHIDVQSHDVILKTQGGQASVIAVCVQTAKCYKITTDGSVIAIL